MTSFVDFIAQTVSGTPGTGSATLSAAVTAFPANYMALGAADDGNKFDGFWLDTSGRESFTDALYTDSTKTLTRGTFVKSSTGSLLSLTSAAIVSVSPSATRAAQWNRYTRGGIVGLGLTFNSTTALDIAAGECMINGQSIVYAGGTVTSGSTMKNLNNATVTLGASKAYHVYVTNGAGGLPTICIQNYAEATYGGAPVYDLVNDYYKAAYATVGINARRIGKIWTDASSHILPFLQKTEGRTRTASCTGQTVLTGSNPSYTAMTLTPFITADDEAIQFNLGGYNGASNTELSAAVSPDSSNSVAVAGGLAMPSYSSAQSFDFVLNYSTLYGKIVFSSGGGGNIVLTGFKEYA